MANTKLSQIASGGAVAGATDVVVAVRSGTTDLLVTPVTLDLAQQWSAVQTFPVGMFSLLGSSTGYTILNSANAGGSNFTATLPANTGTVAELNLAQTWTAAQKFTNGDLLLLGSSTGYTILESGLSGGSNNTLLLPITASDTLAGLGTAQTWTAVQTFTNSDFKLLGSSTGATTFTSANASATNYTLTLPAITANVAITGAPIAVGASTTATAAQAGLTFLLNTASGSVLTLPAATGTGNKYEAVVSVSATSAAHKVLAGTGDYFIGNIIGQNGNTPKMFQSPATTNHSLQMPFSGSQPSGGFIGDKFTFTDIGANLWEVTGFFTAGTTPTTPFSSATS